VEEAGLAWHSNQRPYWNESAFYPFTAQEVGDLEAVTNELEAMTLRAAEYVISNKLYSRLKIPPAAVPLIEASWLAEPPSLYGRFDLAYDGTGPPKLLEYNADTPTSLLEAAVIQWYWIEDTAIGSDQFNSLHERLIALWKELAPSLPEGPHRLLLPGRSGRWHHRHLPAGHGAAGRALRGLFRHRGNRLER
jgi:glutathionylspermidine synthase